MTLTRFGFPDAQQAALENLARSGEALALSDADETLREAIRAALVRLARACPTVAPATRSARNALEADEPKVVEWWEPELELSEAPEPPSRSIVARIMRDLHAS